MTWRDQTSWLLTPDGNFKLDGYGRLVEDKTVVSRCLMRLMTPRGSYWRDPTMGSRLHEIREAEGAKAKIKNACEEALAPLLQEHVILGVIVGTVEQSPITGALQAQIFVQVTADQIADIGMLPLGGVL